MICRFHGTCLWQLSNSGYGLYSQLSLPRLRLSRITAYLEVKIVSLFKHENLIIGNKILWKRGEMANKEQFLLFFHTIFNISLTSQVKLHIHLWNVVVRFVVSSNLQIQYVEVRISRIISESLGLQDNKSTVLSNSRCCEEVCLDFGGHTICSCPKRLHTQFAGSADNEVIYRMKCKDLHGRFCRQGLACKNRPRKIESGVS